MNENIFILTEGGRNIGLGHITRCLSLYQAFEEVKVYPQFIINGEQNIISVLENIKYINLDWMDKFDLFLEKISENDIVIIDSYLANFEIYKKISNKVKKLAFFDDYNRIKYPKGILINGSIFANEINYDKNEKIKYLLGTDFISIRKEFWNNEVKVIREKIESIMIIFGGNDIRNLVPSILESMVYNFPDIKKNVIVNDSFNNLDQIKRGADNKTNLIFSPSEKELKNIMIESDIAISAAGQTLYELSIVGTPTIMIGIADNQKNNILGWEKTGIIDFAGDYYDHSLNDHIVKLIYNLENKEIRIKKSNDSINLINRNGSKKIVEELISKI